MSYDLYSAFIAYYQEYEKFQEEKRNSDQLCLTLFGVSGAGKSTFLSRLKSNMSPTEFFNAVIARYNDKITLEEITIGRSITSVTIVPRLHTAGNLSIYDVPGFKDTDDNKRIIINILHKCLLNYVKKNKFIAVLRLDLIEEERMTQLIGDYYDSFSQLFGKNYRKNIDNVYFVITHFDKHSLSVKDIVNILKERVYNAIDLDKDQLAYFLKRLTKKHIIVDYATDTQESLLSKMDELLFEEAQSITQSDITITNLDVYENELNKRLKSDLQNYVSYITKESDTNLTELKKHRDTIQLLIEDRKEIQFKKEQIECELNGINEFLQTVDKSIDLILKNNDNLEYEKKTLLTDIQSQEVILDVFDKTIKDQVMVNVRADVSQKSFTGYFLENIIDIDQSLYKERVILITRYENRDETLMTYLNTGSLIPDDIKKIKQFQGDIVLYNNNTCLRNNIRVDTTYNESTKQLTVHAKCDLPFKFYLYYTQELNNTVVFKGTKIHFTNKIKVNQGKCTELSNQVKNGLDEISILKLKDLTKRSRRDELQVKHTEFSLRQKELEQTLERSNFLTSDIFGKQYKFLSGIKSSDLYNIGTKIMKIFVKNSLKSSISEQIIEINKFVDESMMLTTNFKDNLSLIQK